MKEKNNKKFHFRLPKRNLLTLILLIVIPIALFFIIAIPVLYVNEYNNNKVTPFASDISNIDPKLITYGDKDTIKDFNFVLYCSNYNNETGSISFRALAYENETTSSVVNLSNQISIKVGMYSNWIKTEASVSSRSRHIAPGPKSALASSRYYADFSVSGIPTLPKKGGLPFIKIKNIPVYAYVTYKTLINGSEATKYYILKYDYDDYIIDSMELAENRQKEVRVYSSNIQWRYVKDTSWTTLTTIDYYIGLETRVSDTHIQYKRKAESEWKDLKPLSELQNYEQGKSIDTRVYGSSIQWKYSDETNYRSLITGINDPELRVENGVIQWKRKYLTEWNTIKAVSELEGYEEGKTVETKDLRVNSGNVQWRWNGESDYKTIQTVTSLMGFEIRINPDSNNLEWKCADEEIWTELVLNGKIISASSLDTKPAVIGPTVGGI